MRHGRVFLTHAVNVCQCLSTRVLWTRIVLMLSEGIVFYIVRLSNAAHLSGSSCAASHAHVHIRFSSPGHILL